MDQSGRFPDKPAEDDAPSRLLIEAIDDYAICALDADGRVLSWNAGARRSLGYEAHEILGEHLSRFFTEEDRAAGTPGAALHAAAMEGRYEAEVRCLRKSGERFWGHMVIDPIRAPDGALSGFAVVLRDITARKQAEDALRTADQQFRLLVQGVTDYAIYLLDPAGRVTNWNAGAERIKGYKAEEIIGQHFSRFYTEEDRAAGAPEIGLAAAIREGRFEREGWRVRKDGSRFWAHVVIDAVHGESGEVIGFAKVTRDVTERRETQKALERAQQALFQAQKMESIGQLTGGVAHDFNNLLMAVLGSLELVRKRLDVADAKTLDLLDNAIHGAQRGAALTRRMLAFARRQELKTEAVDLAALTHGMTGLLERSIGPGVRIGARFPAGLPLALTDPNQLEAALLNLVVNARDSMPDGGRIVITAHEEALAAGNACGLPAGDYVCLAVIDTGAGMDEQTLEHAAEPFFTTKGVGKGTGLGLSMVHGLAEQSGGRLRLHSRPGAGTRVEVWLPAAVGEEGRPLRRHSPEAAPARQPRSRRVILAVDDDSLVLMNTSAMLEDLGHTVIEARSGDQALQVLAGNPEVDLVISDQAMPNMTGLQLARAARAMRPGIPIVLATGYAELPAGADPDLKRLAKPFTQAELAAAVADAAGG